MDWHLFASGGGERCTNRPCRVPADCRKDDFCDVSMPVGSTLAQQGYRGYCCRRQISGGIAGGSHGVVGGGSLVLDTVSGGSGLMDTGVVRGSSRKTVTSWDSGTQSKFTFQYMYCRANQE